MYILRAVMKKVNRSILYFIYFTVEVEMSEATFSDEMRVLVHFERQLESDLKAALGIQAACVLVNPRTIERSEGKAKRVIDRRELSNAR